MTYHYDNMIRFYQNQQFAIISLSLSQKNKNKNKNKNGHQLLQG